MRVWRLSQARYAPGLDGRGARLVGGRWNSPGLAAVYCAGSPALAVLEVFVNLPDELRQTGLLPPYRIIALDLPGDADLSTVDAAVVASVDQRAAGDAWLASRLSLGLRVPSVIVPQEHNVVLNPAHPDMAAVSVALDEPFRFDTRLFT